MNMVNKNGGIVDSKFFWDSIYTPSNRYNTYGVVAQQKKDLKDLLPKVKRIMFNNPATIIFWEDNTKTVVKCGENDTYDVEKGLAMAILKKLNNNKGSFNRVLTKMMKANMPNKSETNLFITKEEAQAKCDELNKERVYINTDKIVIQDSFKQTHPSIAKIQRKLDYYKENGKFEKDIIINKDNVLIDGYITYLICKMLNIDFIWAVVEESCQQEEL